MNRFFALALATAIGTANPAFAAETTSDACMEIYEIAYATMKLRQYGTPMPEMMKDVKENSEPEDTAMRVMVMTAYSEPRLYLTIKTDPESKERVEGVATDFADKWYFLCLEEVMTNE